MVLGNAPEQEILRMIPVGRAEFPERVADRIQAGNRHVDRAEAAVRGPVRRAELLRPEAGQRLHLVAPGEERELRWVRRADFREAPGEDIERFVPFDLDEVARAALAPGPAHERFAQSRGRVLLHDPGRALGAEHALVDRMIAVALDEAELAVFERDLDAAAARAHVAGREFDLLARMIFEGNFASHAGSEGRGAVEVVATSRL